MQQSDNMSNIEFMRSEIHDDIKHEFMSRDANKNITPDILRYMFLCYDHGFFQGEINRLINEKNTTLELEYSSKLKTNPTACKRIDSTYILSVSKSISTNLFQEGPEPYLIYGLTCVDRLQCIMAFFEHELCHLVEMLKSNTATYQERSTNIHDTIFTKIAFEIFGHSDYKHTFDGRNSQILPMQEVSPTVEGVLQTPEEAKTNFSVGDNVNFDLKGDSVRGVIIKMNPKRAKIREIGTLARELDVYYNLLNKE